jgi:hypothetical protein
MIFLMLSMYVLQVLAGTGEALKERGEKLATTAEKSAKMEEVCEVMCEVMCEVK